jgi:hypothetical protein
VSNDDMDDDEDLSLEVDESDFAADVTPDATVTWGTDWTVATIIDQLKRNRFDLEPDFQRRDVWSAAKRSRFIESLLLGIPVPQIILAERQNSRGKFIVLDGKQRLRSLQRFAGLDGDPMRLTGLDVLKNLQGLSYQSFQEDPELDSYLSALDNGAVRAVIMRGWRNESLLYMTFMRLNSNVVGLSPQELRRALHPGEFMSFVMQRSSESEAIKRFLRITAPDFRMRDAELLTRHLALSLYLPSYRGNLRAFLDETCEKGNKGWRKMASQFEYHANGLDSAINLTFDVFERQAFRRVDYTGEYETRRNRAVLDIMAFYLQHPEVRAEVTENRTAVKREFEELCASNPEFSDYLTLSTKSRSAVFGRLKFWGQELSTIARSASRYVP